MLIIRTEQDLRTGLDFLVRAEPVFADVMARTGPPPLRLAEPGFKGLARIVVAQQLSAASAAAIWRRLEAGVSHFEPAVLANLPNEKLRAWGLSAAKIRTLRAIADALDAGTLRFDALAASLDEEVEAHLTAITGIGPWSARIYLLSCLGRADTWPAGDLALRNAARDAFKLAHIPTPSDLEAMSSTWRPWRAVAARLLWAYYTRQRRTQGK